MNQASAFNCDVCSERNSTELLSAYHSAWDFWQLHDFVRVCADLRVVRLVSECPCALQTNPNWWWNEIGLPTQLDQVALLMVAFQTPSEVQYTQTVLNRATWWKQTGENRIWDLETQVQCLRPAVVVGGSARRCWVLRVANQINLGVIVNNATLLDLCFQQLWDTLSIQTGTDGVQVDGCFWQHGPLLQGGSYGGDFVQLTQGTRFAVTSAAVAVLDTLILDGQQVCCLCCLHVCCTVLSPPVHMCGRRAAMCSI
jgi:hypothetical protein